MKTRRFLQVFFHGLFEFKDVGLIMICPTRINEDATVFFHGLLEFKVARLIMICPPRGKPAAGAAVISLIGLTQHKVQNLYKTKMQNFVKLYFFVKLNLLSNYDKN